MIREDDLSDSARRVPLGRHDWIAGALRALLAEGEPGLRVEAIARDMCTTKGSFYWHFRDLADLRTALLADLETRLSEAVRATANSLPRRRIMALVQTPEAGDAAAALRDWAVHDPEAQAVADRLDALRAKALTDALVEAGLGSAATARGVRLLMAARVGIGRLPQAVADEALRDLRHMARAVMGGQL